MVGGDVVFEPERKGNRMGAKLVTKATKDLGWYAERSLAEYIKEKISAMGLEHE